MSSLIIPFPTELRPRLPTILGNVDYVMRFWPNGNESRHKDVSVLLRSGGEVGKTAPERELQGANLVRPVPP